MVFYCYSNGQYEVPWSNRSCQEVLYVLLCFQCRYGHRIDYLVDSFLKEDGKERIIRYGANGAGDKNGQDHDQHVLPRPAWRRQGALRKLSGSLFLRRTENLKMSFRGKQAGMQSMPDPLLQTAAEGGGRKGHEIFRTQDDVPSSDSGPMACCCSEERPLNPLWATSYRSFVMPSPVGCRPASVQDLSGRTPENEKWRNSRKECCRYS